jgi:hypothetical protein
VRDDSVLRSLPSSPQSDTTVLMRSCFFSQIPSLNPKIRQKVAGRFRMQSADAKKTLFFLWLRLLECVYPLASWTGTAFNPRLTGVFVSALDQSATTYAEQNSPLKDSATVRDATMIFR